MAFKVKNVAELLRDCKCSQQKAIFVLSIFFFLTVFYQHFIGFFSSKVIRLIVKEYQVVMLFNNICIPILKTYPSQNMLLIF